MVLKIASLSNVSTRMDVRAFSPVNLHRSTASYVGNPGFSSILAGAFLTCSLLFDRSVHRFSPVLPELQILFTLITHQLALPDAQSTFLQQLCKILALVGFLPQDVFQRGFCVHEYFQVVGYDVAGLAGRAGDEHGALVVAVLGDAVARAVQAGLAGETQFVARFISVLFGGRVLLPGDG